MSKCTKCGYCCSTGQLCSAGVEHLKNGGLECAVIATHVAQKPCMYLIRLRDEYDPKCDSYKANCCLYYFMHNTVPTKMRVEIAKGFFLSQTECVLKEKASIERCNQRTGETRNIVIAGEAMHKVRVQICAGGGGLNTDKIEKLFTEPEVMEALGGAIAVEELLAFARQCDADNKEECDCDECKS